jgi:Fic family protein
MSENKWNWEQGNWPNFVFDYNALAPFEKRFQRESGTLFGSVKHIAGDDLDQLTIEILSQEAEKTSAIEGEQLNRESLQSSIRKNLGLDPGRAIKSTPAEIGISTLMVEVYRSFQAELDHQALFDWHKLVCNGRTDLEVVGGYREHEDPMQVVSNRLDVDSPRVHFEAPPSTEMTREMDGFLSWFGSTNPQAGGEMTPLVRAGYAHLYFLCIHPFEDGNGRIARAISEKAISQDLGQGALLSLSQVIESEKNDYYQQLELHNYTLDITNWLLYFSDVVIRAQARTQTLVEFLIAKSRFFQTYGELLNERQLKVVKRMFEAGPDGFTGGLSSKNYQSIAKTSSATATRDLKNLVHIGALTSKGALKATRYYLNLNN